MKKLKGIDKGILVGVVLTVAFLILWLVTLPNMNEKITKGISSIGPNESEQIKIYYQNVDNFNKALLFGDRTYCEYINNRTMKKECDNSVPDQVVIIEKLEEPSRSNPEDINNFNNAILYNDKIYCSKILDEGMKEECINLQV